MEAQKPQTVPTKMVHYCMPMLRQALTRHQSYTYKYKRIHALKTGLAREGSAFEIKVSCLQPRTFLVVVWERGTAQSGTVLHKVGAHTSSLTGG